MQKSPPLRHRAKETQAVDSPPQQNSYDEQSKRPQRVSSRKEFVQRQSTLDSLGPSREQSEFRGFFNLVTMGCIFFFATTQIRALLNHGTLVGLESIWYIFHRFDLFPAWMVMCFLSFSVVVLQKLILLRIFPRIIVTIMRVGVQLGFFSFCLGIAMERQWPVVQVSFFLAELLVISMKMHSYIMTNRDYDKAYLEKKPDDVKSENTEEKEVSEFEKNHPTLNKLDRIFFGKTKDVQYPENVGFGNFLYFLLVPTMVYELEYPRTQNIRVPYFLEKVLSFIGLWAVMHVLTDTYITPVLEVTPNMSGLDAICQLIIPFTCFYLAIFYIVFDVACNGFAEITRFGDREFYEDWWNSTSWDEFARKWNKPVHTFLLRHVYLESIKSYKMSKVNATLVTFLFSSLIHEFFMAFCLRVFQPYLFFFQMCQIPLIYIGRHPFVRKYPKFGNHFFWFGISLGVPMITILYAREYYRAILEGKL